MNVPPQGSWNMSRETDLDHQFLDLRSAPMPERTFLGTVSLQARVGWFLVIGLAALLGFAVMFAYVDNRVASALDRWNAAEQMNTYAATIQTGVTRIKNVEKQFLLNRDPNVGELFERDQELVTTALERLGKLPGTSSLRQSIATLRDGMAQYDTEFSQLVKAEEALGLNSGTGLSARLKTITDTLKSSFLSVSKANLADQISRIDRQGQETMLSGLRGGIDEISKRYQALTAFLKRAKINTSEKNALLKLLKLHETAMLEMINSRFAMEGEGQRFEDILSYMSPSLENLSLFSKKASRLAARDLRRSQRFARYVIAGGSAAILLWLILSGLVLMRSMTSSVVMVAGNASRLARGDRGTAIAQRGNSNEVGDIAKALGKWADNLIEMDLLRQEIHQTRSKLEQVQQQAEADAIKAADAARAALLGEDDVKGMPPEKPQPETANTKTNIPAKFPSQMMGHDAGMTPGLGSGPISSASQQLTHYSEFVSIAAGDVEKTEALIKGLSGASGQIEDLEKMIMAIRDRLNLLAFGATGEDLGDENADTLIPFVTDQRGRGQPGVSDRNMAHRLDAIRDVTDRAERLIQSLRLSMSDVTSMSQDIAQTASTQALEATTKLLQQSEYLQNMLDGIITKIEPSTGAAADSKQRIGQQSGFNEQQQSSDNASTDPWKRRPPTRR